MEYYNDIQSSTANHAGTVCKTELQTKEPLTTIKAAGYDGIELNGFMIRQSQLNVVSIHEDLGTIQRDPDFVIQETNPDVVGFEFDSYWPTESGVSALQIMKQLGNRIKLYHINDRGTRLTGPSMTPILKSDSIELGCGNMNLTALIEQAVQADVSAIILESHKNWIEKSPIKSLQKSAEFLDAHLG